MGGRGRPIKIKNAIGFGGEGFGSTAIVDGRKFDGAVRAAIAGNGGAGGAGGSGGGASSEVVSQAAIESSLGNKGRNVTNVGKVLPEIKNFSQKNIVSFSGIDKGGTITIKDDNGNVFNGVHEGAGASRVTFAFKEGFVVKFDGLLPNRFADLKPGSQNAAEASAYAKLPGFLKKNAVTGRGKDRVPELLAGYGTTSIKFDNGRTGKVNVNILTLAKGAHDTGISASSKKGKNLEKRLNQYIRGLRNRGVKDISVGQNSKGNVSIHNVYRDPKNGKLTIVDSGLQRRGF